jgi:hypothetical protein
MTSNSFRSAVEWIYAPSENASTLSNGAKDLLELLGQDRCEIINEKNVAERDWDMEESDVAEEESDENAFDEGFNLDEADLLGDDEQNECEDNKSGFENIDLLTTTTLQTLKNHVIASDRYLIPIFKCPAIIGIFSQTDKMCLL